MPWEVYRYDTVVESDGSELTMNGPPVPFGFVLEITQMAVVDITTGNKVLAVGYLDLGGTFRTFCQNQGTNLNMHQLYGEEFLFAGEKPAGRITTPTSGDDCYFSAHGKLWPEGQFLPAHSSAMGKLKKGE